MRSDYALGLDKEPYDFGNAFEVVYDQVSALKLHYGFSADIDDQWQMGVRGSIVRYEMDRASEPWNLRSQQWLLMRITDTAQNGVSRLSFWPMDRVRIATWIWVMKSQHR